MRALRLDVVCAALLLVGALAGRLCADELTSDACLDCHKERDLTGDDDRSMYVSPDAYAASIHSVLACTDCHTDATEIPHGDLASVAVDTCATCHADEVAAYAVGIHAARGDAPPAATCGDCHGDLHTALSHDDPASAAHWSHLATACAKCHAKAVTRAGLPVVQPVQAYLESVHGRSVAAGTRAAVCSDCHGSHAILPAADPRSTIWRGRVPETCGTCHTEVAAQYGDSVHGTALAAGVRDAPACTDCHGEHRILASTDPAAPVFAANIPTETCGRCHGDLRLARKYGLPTDQVASFRDSFHGLAMRAGQVNVANCASCHGVHNILPSSDPRSLINPANLPATCGKCHPGAGASFAIGMVHVLPSTSPTRLEYWVRYLYLRLIALVIGAMLLHTGVDFVVKARRHERPASPAPPVIPERMSSSLRWQHALVMVSFPVLVWTGFALTYPESWWAAPLLRWESRLALRGALHRTAALVILAALAWHVADWLRRDSLRQQLRGLRWSMNDLRYFAARVAWYAGRRRTLPPSGPFSYIEKVEYWAFLWGMLIMSASGLLLWFSDFMLRHLPKWFTDVATAIHFYEAVLATLAIVIWHLYWSVFDPDVYPMDPTWWSGRPPASRVRERQGEADATEPAPDSAIGGPPA